MTKASDASVHASAVRVGHRAVLIRGASGAGKSRLAFDLILAGRAGQIPPTVLIGDDRVYLSINREQLMVRPAPELAGLIEIRGLGIRRCDDFAEDAIVGLVIDLSAADSERMPPAEKLITHIYGVRIPRIPVGPDFSPLPLLLAALTTSVGEVVRPSANCLKGIGNHMEHSIATE